MVCPAKHNNYVKVLVGANNTIALHTLIHSQDGPSSFEAKLYASKKAIVAEIGAAFQEIMAQFEKARHLDDKKRAGSDMHNDSIGHIVRGRFRTAVASLLLDEMKPYLLEGLILTDVWSVAVAFCKEGQWRCRR